MSGRFFYTLLLPVKEQQAVSILNFELKKHCHPVKELGEKEGPYPRRLSLYYRQPRFLQDDRKKENETALPLKGQGDDTFSKSLPTSAKYKAFA